MQYCSCLILYFLSGMIFQFQETSSPLCTSILFINNPPAGIFRQGDCVYHRSVRKAAQDRSFFVLVKEIKTYTAYLQVSCVLAVNNTDPVLRYKDIH